MSDIKFKTQNDKRISCSGTSLQGYIDISYDELVEKLGDPGVGDEYKTDAHWDIEFEDGVVATIYNWKDGQNYNGPAGKPVEDIRDWHIGGNDAKAVTHVLGIWPDHRAESAYGNPMSLTKTMYGVGKVI